MERPRIRLIKLNNLQVTNYPLIHGFHIGVVTNELEIRTLQVHGVLNVVSWGILMPLGAVIARYLKVFKSATPAWFYLHVACQTSAYIVGVSGLGTGLKLGDESGVSQNTHKAIGIAMVCLATVQVPILCFHV